MCIEDIINKKNIIDKLEIIKLFKYSNLPQEKKDQKNLDYASINNIIKLIQCDYIVNYISEQTIKTSNLPYIIYCLNKAFEKVTDPNDKSCIFNFNYSDETEIIFNVKTNIKIELNDTLKNLYFNSIESFYIYLITFISNSISYETVDDILIIKILTY